MARAIHLGTVLRRIREAHGLTQADVANRARIDPAYLSQIETGARVNPRWDTIVRICYALDTSVDLVAKRMGFLSPSIKAVDPKMIRRCLALLRSVADDIERELRD